MTASPAGSAAARLEVTLERIESHASRGLLSGFTPADPATGERWDAGQVLAHVAEFLPYWLGEARRVVESASVSDPVPFGRTKDDPVRVESIEAGRNDLPNVQMATMHDGAAAVRRWLSELSDTAWSARGVHPTMGEMNLERIVEVFMVGHLEQHADQLDAIDD